MVTKSLLIRSVLACAALLAPAACASDDDPSPIEAEGFCEAYVDAFCEGIESCCGGSVSVDALTCRNAEQSYCLGQLLTVDDRGMAPVGANVPARIVFDFDEAGAGAAIARMRSAFSRCDGTPFVSFDDTHFLGEPGSECLQHQDCSEGTRCEHPPRAVFGTCVLAPLEGQECVDICATDALWCAQDQGDSVCVALRTEGQSCEPLPCEAGLACVLTAGSIIGAGNQRECAKLGGAGASCDTHEQCASYSCFSGRCEGDSSDGDLFCQVVADYQGLSGLSGLEL